MKLIWVNLLILCCLGGLVWFLFNMGLFFTFHQEVNSNTVPRNITSAAKDTSIRNEPSRPRKKVDTTTQINVIYRDSVNSNANRSPLPTEKMTVHRLSTWLNEDACTGPTLGQVNQLYQLSAYDFFNLNIKGNQLSSSFRRTLKSRLVALFAIYENMLGRENLRKISIKISFHNSWGAYKGALNRMGIQEKSSQGIYLSKHAQAVVWYKNEDQAIRTAIHESVHILNHALIGVTPFWLNEGMAEYFEGILVENIDIAVKPSIDWTSYGYFQLGPPYDFFNLDVNRETWTNGGQDQMNMYANSWYWIYYLMSSSARKKSLSQLLKEELKDPCSPLDIYQAYDQILRYAPDFDINFGEWQNKTMSHNNHHVNKGTLLIR